MTPIKPTTIAALAAGLYRPTIAIAAAVLVCIIIFLEIAALFSTTYIQDTGNRSPTRIPADTTAWPAAREKQHE